MRLTKKLKHPVWSNVAAALIVILITAIYNFVASLFNKTNFQTEFFEFWNYSLKLWIIAILILVATIVVFALRKIKKPFVHDEETIILDRKLFEKFRTQLFTKRVISNLKANSFSSHTFDLDEINFVQKILNQNRDPNFEFIHPELEVLKLKIINSIEILHDGLSKNIFGINNHHPEKIFVSIPKEWDLDRYRKAQKEIELGEDSVYDSYEEFVKRGRRILKV